MDENDDRSDGIPIVAKSENEKTESLELQLEDTKTWFELKQMISNIVMMSGEKDKRRLLSFLAINWPGHVPRAVEFASLHRETMKQIHANDELKRLLTVPQVKK